MSIERSYYVISGFDLTGFKTDKYDDWKWTNEGERFTCNQEKGEIQLFNDHMRDLHLYLGYIFSANDEYDFDTTKINYESFEFQKPYVINKLNELIDIGVIDRDILDYAKYEIIVFEECS